MARQLKFSCQPLANMVLRTAGLVSSHSATFGMVRDGGKRAHQGIDLASNNGYRCYAVEAGEVIAVEPALGGYGMTVMIRLNCPHNTTLHGLIAFYAHLSRTKVKAGDIVLARDCIGFTGSTGNAKGMDKIETGGHLHFELRVKPIAGIGLQNRVDPMPFMIFD